MNVEYAARGEGLFTVFRVSENLFVLPNEYIADIRNMDDVTCEVEGSAAFRTLLSFGSAVTALSLRALFGLNGEASEERVFITLRAEPPTAVLADEVVAVEKAECFVPQDEFIFTNSSIDKLYVFTETGDIVMRPNIRNIAALAGCRIAAAL